MTPENDDLLKNIVIKIVDLPPEIEELLRELVSSIIIIISSKINLTGLEGITLAINYHQALIDLDKGHDNYADLEPTNDHIIGIAMSARVVRDGNLRSHIVLDAQTLLELLMKKRINVVINTLAHECAHGELYQLFEAAFPGRLLEKKTNALDSFRNDCMLACWNEFGACWRSASLGPANEHDYEGIFLPALTDTRSAANSAIDDYLSDGNISEVLNKVCHLYGKLLKYSAYHLGNLHGLGLDWRNLPTTADALENHWFLPFFERLDIACKAIAMNLGKWENIDYFDELEDIAEDLVEDGGMYFIRHDDDKITLHIS